MENQFFSFSLFYVIYNTNNYKTFYLIKVNKITPNSTPKRGMIEKFEDHEENNSNKFEMKKITNDLKDVKSQVQTIFLTQKKILLKPWQIALIVITSVALVAAGVLAFVIIRKRKHKSYSVHDKI